MTQLKKLKLYAFSGVQYRFKKWILRFKFDYMTKMMPIDLLYRLPGVAAKRYENYLSQSRNTIQVVCWICSTLKINPLTMNVPVI